MTVQSVTVEIARRICDEQNVGYSQPDRRTWYANADAHGRVKGAQNADCSSLVAGCISYGLHHTYGVPWGHKALLEINDVWTGNLRPAMQSHGFNEVPWSDGANTPNGGFKAGDVILSAANEGGAGHVVIVDEDGTNPLVSEAWIAEDGSIDGYLGDQTGQETRTVRYATHPHTRNARWTGCFRFSEAKFFQQWPQFARKGAAKPAPAPAKPAPAAPQHAHGIDVSSHQSGLNIKALWADFVIVKATEDDDYVNPYKDTQAGDAIASGKRLGFYHFARPGDAAAQARYFVDSIRSYVGKATLWLDWEANAVELGPGWAKTFLDTVRSLTSTTPGIYMNGSAANGYNWSSVAASYQLWYAGGTNYSSYGQAYSDPAVPNVAYWGAPLIHQYTEDGRLPGYSGTLDLNRLRDRAAWDRMIGKAAPAAAVSAYTGKANKLDGQKELLPNGELNMATIARLQQVMGTPITGALNAGGDATVKKLQEFLNAAVPVAQQQTLNGSPRLSVDGVLGAATWRTLQFLIMAWHKEYLPAGASFGSWVDGKQNTATVGALQRALNNSKANTGKLW